MPWLLSGAPGGRAAALRGGDFIAVRDDRLARAVGYFSLAELGAWLDGK